MLIRRLYHATFFLVTAHSFMSAYAVAKCTVKALG